MGGLLDNVCRLGALAAVALSFGLAPATAQDAKRPWLDPALLAAAQKEGPLVVYSSMNEQEGLPLFKIFTDATGIKVNYVRAADTPLMGRIAIEFRTKQKAWDILQTTTINKVPPPMMAQIDPPEAKNAQQGRASIPDAAGTGCTPTTTRPRTTPSWCRRPSCRRPTRSSSRRSSGRNRVAIDGTDNEWLKAMFEYYGEQRATEIVKDIVSTLKPIITDGHLAWRARPAPANTRSR